MPTLRRRPKAARWLATAAAAAALALPLAACSGSSSKPAASSSPTRAVALSGPIAQSSSAGIRLRLPSGWHSIPLGNGQIAALTKLFSDENEVGQLTQQMRVGQLRGLQVFAVQPRGATRPGTMSVSLVQASSTTLDALEKELLIGTEQTAATTPVFDRVQLPAGQALRLHYRLADGDSTTQYYVLAGPLAFTLTVTTPDRVPDLATNDAVARSMHLSNAA